MNSEFQSQLDQLEQDISSIDGGRFEKMADEIKKTMDSSIVRQMYDVHRRLAVLNENGQIRKKDFEEKMGQLNMVSMEINGETVGQWIQQEMRFRDTIPYFIEKKKYTRKTEKWLSKGTYGARVSLDEKTIENSTTRGIDLYLYNGGWSWKRESVMDLPDIHYEGFFADRREAWGVGRLGIRYSHHMNGKWHVEDYLNLLSHGHKQLFSPHFISNNELVFTISGYENVLNYCVLNPELIKEHKEPEIKPIFSGGQIKDVRVLSQGLAIYHTKEKNEDILTFIDMEGSIIDEAPIAKTFSTAHVRVDSDNRFFCVYSTPDGSIIYRIDKDDNGLWKRSKVWMSPQEIDDYQILPNQKIALVRGSQKDKEFGILDLNQIDTSLEYNSIDKLETKLLRLQPLPNGKIYVIDIDNNRLIKYDGEVVDE